jgi:hypothetical protein
MSMTLDTILNLHGWAAHPDLSQTVDILARRGRGGGGGHSTHFFFFGGGAGSAILAVPIAIMALFGGYLMRNPDKARGLKERLKGAWGAAASGLDARIDPTASSRGSAPPYPPPYPPTASPDQQGPTVVPPNLSATNGRDFGSAAGQPRIVGQLGSPPESARSFPPPQRAGLTAGMRAQQPAAAPGAVMRFNPPPNWPVPSSGWTPAPDWKPDPAWPAAPPGWQFWVPAVRPAPTTTQRFAAGTTYSGTRPTDFRPRNGSF